MLACDTTIASPEVGPIETFLKVALAPIASTAQSSLAEGTMRVSAAHAPTTSMSFPSGTRRCVPFASAITSPGNAAAYAASTDPKGDAIVPVPLAPGRT